MPSRTATCIECEGQGQTSVPAKPCAKCFGKGRVVIHSHDPRRSNFEDDTDLAIECLMSELATARGTLMTLQSLLDRGCHTQARALVVQTLAEMRPVSLAGRF